MADRYEPHAIEPRWRERWERDRIYAASDTDPRPKWYALTMFPYPSGDLHTGHWYAMAPSDAAARYQRMRGKNVLFPMGFDSFGLPAENAAIRNGVDPRQWTYSNIERMRGQLRLMGASFDWDREVVTSDPEYYRWTQWWFLKLFEHGLAYRAEALANWCPGCGTVLANEQVVDGRCERCDTVVERRMLTQWFFRITNYAEELLRFDGIDWPERIRAMQTNWIGRSEGATLHFPIEGRDDRVSVFTTRPDTVFGATFMVLAPEHRLVDELTTEAQRAAVAAYIVETSHQTEIDRLSTEREKTGVFTGSYALNPFSGERIPIWIADYVLVTYGTGAVMAVPAHDERDFAFATKYGLAIVEVVRPDGRAADAPLAEAFTATSEARMVNSGGFDGTPVENAKAALIGFAEQQGYGEGRVNFRLRDWLISRQRYWGAPIPMIHCEHCGVVPVPESQLPVLLPDNVRFAPTGKSPLTEVEEWVNVACPRCGAPARRESDTMDTFMCSSWYAMRYADPRNDSAPVSPESARKWLPVDQYTGGAEHAVMHLLYARFFWKAGRDMGVVTGDEPMLRLYNQGVILGPDGNRMSKSRGNVVAPDDQVSVHGADAFRCQLMFVGPWDQGGPYNPIGMSGIVRWLHRIWSLVTDPVTLASLPAAGETRDLRRLVHKTIRQVTIDIEGFRFNTLISRLMELSSAMQRARDQGPVDKAAWDEAVDTILLLTAPLAPHIAEELWERRGRPYSVHLQSWPAYDEDLARDDEIELVVQVNGKVRERIVVPSDATEEQATAAVLALERIVAVVGPNGPRKVIYVPGKLVNVVV